MTTRNKPDMLIIWGDDIGISNLRIFTKGMIGYRTPNIDRIAEEGMLFTDDQGEQSCAAGRSAFITRQGVFRTGLSKVQLPGADPLSADALNKFLAASAPLLATLSASQQASAVPQTPSTPAPPGVSQSSGEASRTPVN